MASFYWHNINYNCRCLQASLTSDLSSLSLEEGNMNQRPADRL